MWKKKHCMHSDRLAVLVVALLPLSMCCTQLEWNVQHCSQVECGACDSGAEFYANVYITGAIWWTLIILQVIKSKASPSINNILIITSVYLTIMI